MQVEFTADETQPDEGCCGCGPNEEADLRSNSTFHSMPEFEPEDFNLENEQFEELENEACEFNWFEECNETVSEAIIQNLKEASIHQQNALEDSFTHFGKIHQPITIEEESKGPRIRFVRARGFTGYNDHNVFINSDQNLQEDEAPISCQGFGSPLKESIGGNKIRIANN